MTRHRLLLPIVALIGALLVTTAASAQTADLRIARGDSSRAFTAAAHRGYPAYPAATLTALGAAVETTPRGVRALLGGDTLSFELFSPIFYDAGKPRQLAAPVYRQGGINYIPAQLFTDWLPASRPALLRYSDGVLHVTSPPARDPAAAAAPAPKPAAPASTPPVAANRPPAPVRKPAAAPEPRVVIIDPGHGGRDPGKVGPGGIREKDLTLAIARRLATVLQEKGGYEVHLTRTTDTLIALADRPHMANRWKANRPAALFISIHANSVTNRGVRGFETFFLSDARTADERRVAEMENAAVEYEEVQEVAAADDLDWILNTLRNDFYIRASNDLAEVIQKRFATFHPGPNRGVKQAGFRVLVGAFMPAVLVEMAFISNQQEAALLKDTAFQRKIATGLAGAVEEFFTSHEHLWSTSSEAAASRSQE
jgi:N-acetylmuramoyl-L-alanine amidase